MTDDDVKRIKAREYDQSESGRAKRRRDNERVKRGYHALRDAGFSCAEALRGARRAARDLETKGAEAAT